MVTDYNGIIKNVNGKDPSRYNSQNIARILDNDEAPKQSNKRLIFRSRYVYRSLNLKCIANNSAS